MKQKKSLAIIPIIYLLIGVSSHQAHAMDTPQGTQVIVLPTTDNSNATIIDLLPQQTSTILTLANTDDFATTRSSLPHIPATNNLLSSTISHTTTTLADLSLSATQTPLIPTVTELTESHIIPTMSPKMLLQKDDLYCAVTTILPIIIQETIKEITTPSENNQLPELAEALSELTNLSFITNIASVFDEANDQMINPIGEDEEDEAKLIAGLLISIINQVIEKQSRSEQCDILTTIQECITAEIKKHRENNNDPLISINDLSALIKLIQNINKDPQSTLATMPHLDEVAQNFLFAIRSIASDLINKKLDLLTDMLAKNAQQKDAHLFTLDELSNLFIVAEEIAQHSEHTIHKDLAHLILPAKQLLKTINDHKPSEPKHTVKTPNKSPLSNKNIIIPLILLNLFCTGFFTSFMLFMCAKYGIFLQQC